MFKKLIIPLILVLALVTSIYADQKVTQLTAETDPAADDLIYIVTDALTTPVSKKMSITTLFGEIPVDITLDSGKHITVGSTQWDDGSDGIDASVLTGTLGVSPLITSLTASNYKLFYSAGGGAPVELALGADDTIVFSTGTNGALEMRVLAASDMPTGIDPDNIGTDATPNNKVEASNINIQSMDIQIDGSPGTNDDYTGMPIRGINAGETIAKKEMVYYDTTATEWLLADADVSGEAPAWGMAVTAGSDGNEIYVLSDGFYRYDSWTWTPGALLYLDDTTPGGLTETAPSTTNDIVQPVARAVSATVIYLRVDPVNGFYKAS